MAGGSVRLKRLMRHKPPKRRFWAIQIKQSKGYARHFRPTYAMANVGHPSHTSDFWGSVREGQGRARKASTAFRPPKAKDWERAASTCLVRA
jgi:hypothetical protein